MTDSFSQIDLLSVTQLNYIVKDMNGEGGWKVDNETKRLYYREPVSKKIGGLYNMSFETITYEVVKQFKNKNYIQASISIEFNIVNYGSETKEQEDYRCALICSKILQEHINSITKSQDYLNIDVSINSNTVFDKVPLHKLGTPRLN